MVRDFAYLGDWVSAAGECETAVTNGARFGWDKFRNVTVTLWKEGLREAEWDCVYKSHVMPQILYGSSV